MEDKNNTEWLNSLESIYENLNVIGDETYENNDYRMLVSKTLLKIPKIERENVVVNVIFIFI